MFALEHREAGAAGEVELIVALGEELHIHERTPEGEGLFADEPRETIELGWSVSSLALTATFAMMVALAMARLQGGGGQGQDQCNRSKKCS